MRNVQNSSPLPLVVLLVPLLVYAVALGFAFIAAPIVMFAWNYSIMVAVFNLPTIGYWTAF